MNIGDIQQQSLKPAIRIKLLLINYFLSERLPCLQQAKLHGQFPYTTYLRETT